MSICKGCGQEIRWIKMASGKAMPVCPELVTYWVKKGGSGKVVTPNGEVLSCVFEGDEQTATGLGYVSHYATCPAADSFKKRR